MTRASLPLAALLLAASAAHAQPAAPAPAPVQRVRGAIHSLEGNVLMVDTREGTPARIALTPGYTVNAVIPAQLGDAKPGTFIGTAAIGPKDRLRALEVLIFPESARGSNEGHTPWDLQPGSTMTNATVESEVTGVDGRQLTLVAKGETLKVTVPPGTPIVTVQPGSPALLVPGAHVVVSAQGAPGGGLTASRVSVGKDGLVPPM